MEFCDTQNWKREIRKTLQDKLLQMDNFKFFTRQVFPKKDKVSEICENLSH